jgi:OPA family sugar phosphate sensor protein UhpC-like MFS transporter
MSCGLFLTGVVNIFFGLTSSLTLLAVFWGLNGWFQGFGAPPCVRLLTQWYSHSERGSWWSTWSVSHNVGAFCIAWVAGLSLQYAGWRYALFVPGVVCIFASFFIFNRLRDTPQSIGLPSIEKYRNDYQDVLAQSGDDEKMTSFQIFVEYILKNHYLWLLAVAYFFVYIVRTGVTDWTAQYLYENKDYSLLGASGCVSLFEIGGFFGCLAAGWSSDRLFGAKRGPVNVLFAAGTAVALTAFWYIPPGYEWLDSAAMFALGFCVFGPQMLVGVAAAELTHKRAVATSNGFISIASNIGSAVAGYPLGRIAQDFGWEGFFWAILACCIFSVFVLLPMWGITKNSRLAAAAA